MKIKQLEEKIQSLSSSRPKVFEQEKIEIIELLRKEGEYRKQIQSELSKCQLKLRQQQIQMKKDADLIHDLKNELAKG